MPRVRLLALASLITATVACTASVPAATEAPGDRTAIDKLRADYAAAYNAGDANTLGILYTTDAVSMQDHQPATVGRDAITAMLKTMMGQMTSSLTLTPEETKIMGAWAYDRGAFLLSATPKMPGAATMTEHGKYLVLLAKQPDGTWLLSREIGNSN